MIYVSIPEERPRILPFYLAAEEYIARKYKAGDYFFMWQVEPTVIFGRNQLIENEVNMEFCKKHCIQTYRRKSGGGCVYADMTNIMFSYITPHDNVNTTFKSYIDMIVNMLRKLNVNASTTGRNDIMVDGRKVSGNAFYHISGRSIVHGTMLYDTNMENMVGSITPDDEKLLSKGVNSVRQHITLLKDHITLDMEEFKAFTKNELCSEEIVLADSDIRAIEDIMSQYLTPEFIYGNNPRYTIKKKKRIDNVGTIELSIEVKNNIIRSMLILGDYFLVGDIDDIIAPLTGARLDKETLDKLIPDTRSIIMNLDRKDLIDLMTQN